MLSRSAARLTVLGSLEGLVPLGLVVGAPPPPPPPPPPLPLPGALALTPPALAPALALAVFAFAFAFAFVFAVVEDVESIPIAPAYPSVLRWMASCRILDV